MVRVKEIESPFFKDAAMNDIEVGEYESLVVVNHVSGVSIKTMVRLK